MEKRILFIIPPYFDLKEYQKSMDTATKIPVFTIPYGVLSIASYIKEHARHDVKVEVLDLNVLAYRICENNGDYALETERILKERLEGFRPEVVGISALFNTCYNYLGLISETVKASDARIFQFVGGGLATNLYRDVLNRFSSIDAACFAEGELPITELIDSDDMLSSISASDAWITRLDIAAGRKPKPQFVNDLDEIPFFDFSVIDLNSYSGRALDKEYGNSNERELSIHTSRGCPFDCVFCSNGTVHGKKVRYMSVDKVVSEVSEMIRTYDLKTLLIEDDHFLSDKDRAKKVLKKLAEFKIRLEFPNGIAVYALDEELGVLLKAAGATTIPLAVESGSDYVLRHIIKKPLKVNMIKTAVDILRKNDIKVHAFFVVGLPGEMDEHRRETMAMIASVGFDWCYFFNAIPIAGSRLYEICKKNHYLINDDFSFYNTTKCNIATPQYTPEYIEEETYLMNLEANFVNNYNQLAGNYTRALHYFINVAERYPGHALAHYAIAKTYAAMGSEPGIVEKHRQAFRNIVDGNETWRKYAGHFNLQL